MPEKIAHLGVSVTLTCLHALQFFFKCHVNILIVAENGEIVKILIIWSGD